MKVLFITHDYPNYVPDLLLHGLRRLLGADVVDFPRKDCVYDGVLGLGICPEDQKCPGWFPQDEGRVDRTDVWEKCANNYFDLVLCDIRAVAVIEKNLDRWPAGCVLIDGEDSPHFVPPGPYVVCRRETDGSDYSIPLPMALPVEVLNWISRYDGIPKKHTIGFLGSTHDGERRRIVEQLSRWYPDSLFAATDVPSRDNSQPNGRLGRDAYYRAIQQCRFVLSLPGAGYDTFRFWENAACNSIHLAVRMPLYIPDDFEDRQSIVRFKNLEELRGRIDALINSYETARSMAGMARYQLLSKHLTTHRAEYVLHKTSALFKKSPAATAKARVTEHIGQPVEQQKAFPSPRLPKKETQALYLGLVKGDGYGWGICSRYLIRELSRRMPVRVLRESDDSARNPHLAGDLFQAIVNTDFDAMFPHARGRRNFAYTFFENELTSKAVKNASAYDLVFGGSTWCRDRMREKGIDNCAVLIQGVDPDVFYPIGNPPPEDRFVIFSGGKFELRKGQDLVLKAVGILQAKYPDVWLVNCWYNLWPTSTRLMSYSSHIRFRHTENASWTQTMLRTYAENGLDAARIITHELLPQEDQRAVYAQTHVGVFPNRCEGGTNLVLMEYMACAKPVIVSNTSGHKDVVHAENALLLENLKPYHVKDAAGTLIARWEEPSLDELVERLEFAYHHRAMLTRIGQRAGKDMESYTWHRTADALLMHLSANGMVKN